MNYMERLTRLLIRCQSDGFVMTPEELDQEYGEIIDEATAANATVYIPISFLKQKLNQSSHDVVADPDWDPDYQDSYNGSYC